MPATDQRTDYKTNLVGTSHGCASLGYARSPGRFRAIDARAARFPSLNPRRRLSLSRSAVFHLGQPLQVISSAYLRLKSSRVPFRVPTAHRAGHRAGHPLYVAADYDRTDMKLDPWPAMKSKGAGKRPPRSRDETISNNSLCFHASTFSHCEGALRHGCQMLCVSCGERRDAFHKRRRYLDQLKQGC